MKLLLTIFTVLFSTQAFAGLDLGKYEGVTPEGEACSLIVKSVSYDRNLKHPLNERIQIETHQMIFDVFHPSVIDHEAGTVLFDRDHLVGTVGTQQGAIAGVLKMVHSEDYHGPSEFTFIHHNYKNRVENRKDTCLDIRHVDGK